jgi:hypothetical protein
MTNTADVTVGNRRLITAPLSASADTPLVSFYDIHERKGEVILFCPGHHTSFDIILKTSYRSLH